MHDQLWVEPVGDIIIARVRGVPSEELLRECQDRVLELVRDTGRSNVLYDALEMQTPPLDVPLFQRKLNEESGFKGRRALVVPNSKLAYMARIAFGDGDHRVFYNDMIGAIHWLGQA
jgi:hypothetical protein